MAEGFLIFQKERALITHHGIAQGWKLKGIELTNVMFQLQLWSTIILNPEPK